MLRLGFGDVFSHSSGYEAAYKGCPFKHYGAAGSIQETARGHPIQQSEKNFTLLK